jgi:prolyl-tRNA synthetase
MKIYSRLGIGGITYKTFASGEPFSKFSHEFQTISDIGEDTIYLHKDQNTAVNKEVLSDEVLAQLKLDKRDLVEKKAVEVGNIFTFGWRYSEPLGLFYVDQKGVQQPVFMGSYGIGISRLMGLLAEHFADDRGLIWPAAIAPFRVYLCRLGNSPEVIKLSDEVYGQLTNTGVGVIYDDRDERAGEMFADADLIGIPVRLIISDKTAKDKAIEVKARTAQEPRVVPVSALAEALENTAQI